VNERWKVVVETRREGNSAGAFDAAWRRRQRDCYLSLSRLKRRRILTISAPPLRRARGTFDVYYFNGAGKRFRSRVEVRDGLDESHRRTPKKPSSL
jgi:hypothetical protein